MDSCLALQILSKHLALEVDFLQAVLKVHYTLRRERETWLVEHKNQHGDYCIQTNIICVVSGQNSILTNIQSWVRG